MFLDDINRDNQSRGKKWQYWDHHEYVDVGETEHLVSISQEMNLLSVKNLSDTALIVSFGGMHTMLKKDQEKHFTEMCDTQCFLRMKDGSGRVFVGQSRSADTSRLPDVMKVLICGILVSCCVGCVQVTEYDDPFLKSYQVSNEPYYAPIPTAPSAPKNAQMPDMPNLVMD